MSKTNDAPIAPVFASREAALVAPFTSASIANTAAWEASGVSLTGSYVAHIAALAILFPVATPAEIMADFTATVPGSKVKGTPAVTKSQLNKVLKADATLADMRRDTNAAELAQMNADDFAVCVASAGVILQVAHNALKNAPKVAKTKDTLTSAAAADAQDATGSTPGAPVLPSDALDLASHAMACIAALRDMSERGNADATVALAMVAATFAEPVAEGDRIAA